MRGYIKTTIVYCFLLQGFSGLAQASVKGRCINENSENVAFVNIGLKGKNIGTCSDVEGRFSISIPESHLKDSLTFHKLGFKERRIPINTLITKQADTIQLSSNHVTLKEVFVTTEGLIEKKFGITRHNSLISIVDASINQSDIFEIAQVIHLPKSLSRINSVSLFIYEDRKDSGLFRINFYKLENGVPGKKLNKTDIIRKELVKEGWLKFDLSGEKIYLKNDVVAAIEFIPCKAGRIKYEVKIGGTSKSFVRSNSLGEWQTPPHHYRLFVSALVSDTKDSLKEIDEETESSPSATMYSENVKDSFSVFISLPKNYAIENPKKYPVVYLLDANFYFDFLKDNSDAIIVGIGYRNAYLADSLRERDFTFPSAVAGDSMRISGGAQQFLRFIKQELIPFVDHKYNTDTTNRTLMGHSLGAYFSLFALSEQWNGSNYFNKFVAASPSLDYANRFMLEKFRNLTQMETSPKTLFITAGGDEGLNEFPEMLKILQSTSLKLKSMVFSKMGHMETAVITFKTAIR